jgi:hypothetical protein
MHVRVSNWRDVQLTVDSSEFSELWGLQARASHNGPDLDLAGGHASRTGNESEPLPFSTLSFHHRNDWVRYSNNLSGLEWYKRAKPHRA